VLPGCGRAGGHVAGRLINDLLKRHPGYIHWLWVALVAFVAFLVLVSDWCEDQARQRRKRLLSLGIVLIAGLLIAWILNRTPEDEAVSAIRELNGHIHGDGILDRPVRKVTFEFGPAQTAADDDVQNLITHLRALPQLETVDVRYTHISAKGVARLREELPNVKVEGWQMFELGLPRDRLK
jgi:hypothetical protein